MNISFLNRCLLGHKKIAGIEILALGSGVNNFNLTILKKKANNFEIESEIIEIDNWDSLKNELGKGVPLSLTFNGKGVLHKKIDFKIGEDDNQRLHKILPNARVDDFYIQFVTIEPHVGFISVIRREIVDDFLKLIKSSGFIPLSVSLGPLILNVILPLVKYESTPLQIGNYSISLIDDMISDFEINNQLPSTRKLSIAEEDIIQSSAIAFASAFRGLFIPDLEIEAFVPLVEELKTDGNHQKLFRILGFGFLFFFLGIMLLNFVLFDFYNSKNSFLVEKYQKNKGMLDYIDEMKLKISKKNAFIEFSGFKNPSKTSFYADRIAMDLPDRIRLNEININPVEKNIKLGESIIFEHENIIVRGKCKKSSYLNSWILALRQNDWVKDILLINYQQENSSEPGFFEIKIILV